MNFSSEELYSQFGQFDKFLTVTFQYGSDPFLRFGSTLMGTLIYTLNERNEMKSLVQQEAFTRTNRKIRFKPSELEELSTDQLTFLDKEGFDSKDISSVQYINLGNQENRFDKTGDREIPNTHTVEFNSTNVNMDSISIGFLTRRMARGYKLSPQEKIELFGMLLYYDPDRAKEVENLISIEEKESSELPSDYYFKRSKQKNKKANKQEIQDLANYLKNRTSVRLEMIKKELRKSTERFNEVGKVYNTSLQNLIEAVSQFDYDLILPYKFPIWWNFERFLHIYCRHVKETKIGERFEDKTIFRYKIDDIRNIVKRVVEKVYSEVEDHFENNYTDFKRMGTRSVYYDGVYYRLEIKSSGLLLNLHPYNDDSLNKK